jgi:hypothetical protein
MSTRRGGRAAEAPGGAILRTLAAITESERNVCVLKIELTLKISDLQTGVGVNVA